MKIALCFFGKFTTTEQDHMTGFEIPYHYLKKNILNNDIDIFLHGWNYSDEDSLKLLELFKPKKFVIEKQINFVHPFQDYNFVTEGPFNTQSCIFKLYSKSYSIKKVIEMVPEDYDLIFLSRYDIIFYEKFEFNMFSKENFYVSHGDDNYKNWYINDAWFITGLDVAKKISKVFDRLNDYLNFKSDYFKFISSKGLSQEHISSPHPIWRYRLEELGLSENIYCYGADFITWGSLRNLNIRNPPCGGRPNTQNILLPEKYSLVKKYI